MNDFLLAAVWLVLLLVVFAVGVVVGVCAAAETKPVGDELGEERRP